MFEKIIRRMISGLAAVIITAANVLPSMPMSVVAEDISAYQTADELSNTSEASVFDDASELNAGSEEDTDYRHMSFELYPNGEETQKTVTLDGMMPKDASASAVDVTEDYLNTNSFDYEKAISDDQEVSVLAAYNITITDGENEYQPCESLPILVEITDPEITENGFTELWHIQDDGQQEQITDFTIEDGKISFYATGFSVYAIVEAHEPFSPELDMAATLDDLTGDRASSGFYLFYGNNNYFTSSIITSDCFKETKNISEAAVWYLEQDGNYYKIYTYVNGEKKYIHNKNVNLIELSDTGDLFDISEIADKDAFYFKKNGENKWLQHSGSGGGIRYYTTQGSGNNAKIQLYYADTAKIPDDYYELDGVTYGLMNYSGGTSGNALMADETDNQLPLMDLVLRTDSGNLTLYVSENQDISMWTFHSVAKDIYTISTTVDGVTKYLKIDNNGLSLADEAEASEIKVTPGSGTRSGKIQLSADGKTVAYDSTNGFITDTPSADRDDLWLNFVEPSTLSQDDYVTYSAKKISVSDVQNQSSIIIYTRIWNDTLKAYEFYAIDHDGSLVPCYERGDSIMWIGSQINTLLWDFTEYYYAGTNTPNYYYELYNSYSGKYIAPQINGGQILSDGTIGLNMPGRQYGEYYTDILAWDDSYYAYAGLEADAGNENIISCVKQDSADFYFATVEPPVESLTTVDTLDNSEYGITMKMIDYPNRAYQADVIGSDAGSYTKNLLSNDLKDNGYPTATNGGRSLYELYSGATEVNHLFLQSTYEESGYFEFDSCQNFATLIKSDGTVGTDFTVYKELGTTDIESKYTLKHGQFFPYDTISAGAYSTKNPENLYSALANPGYESVGLLPDSDPRKYEKLHTVGSNPNYHNGMELEAGFVQTPSGKDAWGHDVIFEFTGDDDFWLYVDGELVIDLGGIHPALAGSVNFATGQVIVNGVTKTLRQVFQENYTSRNPSATQADINAYLSQYFEDGEVVFKDYSSHTMKIFYMERGAGASNLHMRFNLTYVTPGHVMLTKNVTGTDDLDYNLVQFPYQIWYKDEIDGTPHLLTNDDDLVSVTYQNSTQKVDYAQTYTPFNSTQSYSSVYFLSPGKTAEISFPANTIEYKVIECGVNTEVYDYVKINDEPVTGASIGNAHRMQYESGWLPVSERPNIVFENHVDPEGLRTLSIQKKLYDENGSELTAEQDPTTFSFRLYLTNGADDSNAVPELANMYKYRVKDPDGYLCKWDAQDQRFVPTTAQNYEDLTTDAEKQQVTFETSINGKISKIPAGYTIEVPNLPVGTKFKVEERDYEIPLGYKLTEYDRESGSYRVDDGDTLNSGRVRANESPKMYVKNKRGCGLQVNKIWSDSDYTVSHAPIYTAVYAGGTLLTDTIKRIEHPSSSVRYFFDELEAGCTFDQYEIREVKLINPVCDTDGNVTSYLSIEPIANNGEIAISATPNDADTEQSFNYHVVYDQGEIKGTANNTRTDTITNSPDGGIALRLFEWNSETPLANGTFELTVDGENAGAASYTSDENGIITILYSFEQGKTYVLTQTASPTGYIGLASPVSFTIENDNSVQISNPNGSGWADEFKPVSNSIYIGYIDVHNRKFTLKALKSDSRTNEALPNAHFALYRSVKSSFSGMIRDYDPLPGYEDLVTDENGYIPQLDSTLPPGTYYLTENDPPVGYEGLSEDIIFTVSPLGVVTINSQDHTGFLQSTASENDYLYLINVPNTKINSTAILTITKTVKGSFGSKDKDFTFTLNVDGADASEEYVWTKNGTVQTEELHPNGTFTMKHGDEVTIILPINSDITITENNQGYVTEFKLGDADSERTSIKEFTITEDTQLNVTNTLNGILPTGITTDIALISALLTGLIACGFILVRRHKRSLSAAS